MLTSFVQGRADTSPDGDKTVNGSTDLVLQNPRRPKTTPIVIGLRNSAPALSSFRRAMISFAGNVKAKLTPNHTPFSVICYLVYVVRLAGICRCRNQKCIYNLHLNRYRFLYISYKNL